MLERGFYVILRVPLGTEYVHDGEGGGGGFGYATGAGLSGWMTADGEDWVRLHEGYGFAVQPQYVAAGEGMLVMLGAARRGRTGAGSEVETALLPARPNPFNPMTTIRFSLRRRGPVSLRVYNLQGELVRELARDAWTAGRTR